MVGSRTLTPELRRLAQEIEAIARDAGLDFFDVVFETVDAQDVNALAAYGGFPVRYPSWRFGMEYERFEKGYSWGLSKIYELVINNDPAYAYLVRSNSLMEQKLVMAHVFGHADFFKHNVWFGPTDRRMLDAMASHGTRIRRLIDQHGQDEVERFMDVALSLDNLIDPYLPLRRARGNERSLLGRESRIERARRGLEAALDGVGAPPAPPKGGELPTFDILGFLTEHAQVEDWQREVLRIVRDEAYYFLPQRITKVMNEGWASFWHSRILTAGVLGVDEIIDFADCHSGATAVAPGQLNPYKLGIDLFRHAEHRGLDLFRLRRVHNDATFVDTLLDEEFAQTSQLFLYQRNGRNGRLEISSREFAPLKARILRDLTWGGAPQIELVEIAGGARGELVMRHRHDGRDLQLGQAGQTLRQIARLWGAPVQLATQEEGQGRRVWSDGREVRVAETGEGAAAAPSESPTH